MYQIILRCLFSVSPADELSHQNQGHDVLNPSAGLEGQRVARCLQSWTSSTGVQGFFGPGGGCRASRVILLFQLLNLRFQTTFSTLKAMRILVVGSPT